MYLSHIELGGLMFETLKMLLTECVRHAVLLTGG